MALAGFTIVPRHVLGRGFVAPSDKLQVAGIGAGGKGESDLWNFFKSGKADIAFLCDVDERQSGASRKRYPNAKVYKDYREMLDKEHKLIDAVSVSIGESVKLGRRVLLGRTTTAVCKLVFVAAWALDVLLMAASVSWTMVGSNAMDDDSLAGGLFLIFPSIKGRRLMISG